MASYSVSHLVKMAADWALVCEELPDPDGVLDGGLHAVEVGAAAYFVDFVSTLHEANRVENERHEFADMGGEG